MKFKFSFLLILVFSFLIISPRVFASTSDGTIDSNYKYAYGENVGFIDFGSTAGSVHITDTALSGSAYGENIGWINLSTVTNNNEGNLSGYAWGENVGFIDFSKVTIGTDGVFAGSAYGENIGWITFGTTNNKVVTDWRPKSSRASHSSGSYLPGYGPNAVIPKITPSIVTPSVTFTVSTPSATPLIINRILKLVTPRMWGDDILALQTFLNMKGYDVGIPDGNFGPKTKTAVIAFQKINGLTPDGSLGPNTIKFINGPSSTTFIPLPAKERILQLTTPRMIGNDIFTLQTYLNTNGYDSGTPDGIFNNKTKQAVIKFQLANQLKGDGVVGPMTRSKMK